MMVRTWNGRGVVWHWYRRGQSEEDEPPELDPSETLTPFTALPSGKDVVRVLVCRCRGDHGRIAVVCGSWFDTNGLHFQLYKLHPSRGWNGPRGEGKYWT